jgi:hypothetical protein
MRGSASRRGFLLAGAAVCAAVPLGLTASAQDKEKEKPAAKPKRTPKPKLEPEMVKEFVIAGHGKPERVKELLDKEPAIVNASWDWGGGDWETALGGAAHMGRRDIALILLERKARMDLFAAAMLGKLEIVKATLTAFPDALHVPGPHGIKLITHAEKGGKEAAAVLEFLQELAKKTNAS